MIPRRRPQRLDSSHLISRIQPYIYLVPALAIVGFVVAWPIVEAIRLSFFRAYLLLGLNSETFVGLGNYIGFFEDEADRRFMLNTALFVGGSLVGQFALGMTLALLLNRRLPLRGLWRGLALIPWAMPVSVVALTWRWVFDGQWGILNFLLRPLGVQPVAWLSDPVLVWPSVLLVSVWWTFPFVFVLLLSGLQSIPLDVYEAARIDGAGSVRTFVRVTLPLLKPVMIVAALLSLILLTREFAAIWTITQGGPGTTTMTLSPWAYVTSFRFFQMGQGAAIGVILGIFSLAYTVLYLRQIRFDTEPAQ
jgi:multiple sugar transport system permease protein